jgi:hypothetical protein
MKLLLVSALSVVVTASCALLPRGHAGPGVRVFVGNESRDHVEVVVSRDGGEQTHSRVWKDQYPVFHLAAIPDGQVSSIVVAVVSDRGESFRTDTILARAGTSITLRLRTPLRSSRWSQSHRVALPTRHASRPAD